MSVTLSSRSTPIYSFFEKNSPLPITQFLDPRERGLVFKTVSKRVANYFEDLFFKGDEPFFCSGSRRKIFYADSKSNFNVFINKTGEMVLYARLSCMDRRLPFLDSANTVVLYDDFEEQSKKIAIEVDALSTIDKTLCKAIGQIQSLKIGQIQSLKNGKESSSSSEEEDSDDEVPFDSMEVSLALQNAMDALHLSNYFELLDRVVAQGKRDQKTTLKMLALERMHITERLQALNKTIENFSGVADELPHLVRDKVCFFSKNFLAAMNYQFWELSLAEGDVYPRQFALVNRGQESLNPDHAVVLSPKSQALLHSHVEFGAFISLESLSNRELFAMVNLRIESLFNVNQDLPHVKNARKRTLLENRALLEKRAALLNGYLSQIKEVKKRGFLYKDAHLFLHPEALKKGTKYPLQHNFNRCVKKLVSLYELQLRYPSDPQIAADLTQQREILLPLKKAYTARDTNEENSKYFDHVLRVKAYNLLNKRAKTGRYAEPSLTPLLASLDQIEEAEKNEERAEFLARQAAAQSTSRLGHRLGHRLGQESQTLQASQQSLSSRYNLLRY